MVMLVPGGVAKATRPPRYKHNHIFRVDLFFLYGDFLVALLLPCCWVALLVILLEKL